jgi:hypothetical protein
MAVKSSENEDKTILILEFDIGDKEKFEQLLKDWNFVDEQSMLRFMISAMLLTSDKTLTINTNEGSQTIAPKDDSLKKAS